MKQKCDPTKPSKVVEDAEFDMYVDVISNPDITAGEEKYHLVSLIKKRRKVLIKRLVLTMTGLGIGKSKVFKSLSAQYLKFEENKAKNQGEERKSAPERNETKEESLPGKSCRKPSNLAMSGEEKESLRKTKSERVKGWLNAGQLRF